MTRESNRGALGIAFLALVCLASPARADKTCLTGSDPAVAADAAQVAALETQILAACPCASFDGTKGKKRSDYASCTSALIKAAVRQGSLRAQCKARLVQAHKFSTCGISTSQGASPCLWVKPSGKMKCTIATASQCQSDSRYTRTACPAYRRCVDAGDTNGDHRVGVGDSGACIAPPTPTSTNTVVATATSAAATATASVAPTETVTAVPTETPTPTASLVPTWTPTETLTPTATPTPDWVFCAHAGEICQLPARNQLLSFNGVPGPGATTYVTTVSDTSIECSPAVLFPDQPYVQGIAGDCYYLSWTCDNDTDPVGYLAVDRFGDFPETRPLPRPPLFFGDCQDGAQPCHLANALSADFEHEISALVIDPRICSPDDEARISYHWEIRWPPGANNNQALFVPRGITGYREPVLKFSVQSMPTLAGIGGPRYWWLYLDITREPHTDFPMTPAPIVTRHLFHFSYTGAAASISMATWCQLHTEPDPSCQVDNLLRAPAGTY